jgi:hypothetical protein
VSVNKFLPHVLVIPEDDADSRLANGFLLEPSLILQRIQVLPVAGGWIDVLNLFESNHLASMDRYTSRFLVLLIDFDDQEDRLGVAQARIPERLRDRVFILGALSEPEKLKSAGLGSYEAIGLALARDCYLGTETTWSHRLLRHNASELGRLRHLVRPILFQRN